MILSVLMLNLLNSCAYYNTFYNAEQYFEEAQQLTRENQQEKVSRQELLLYSKSIEKCRKLLNKYPDSKYTDDAQFLIAKAYYFKGDFNSAKSSFERLALEYSNSPFALEVPLWVGRCLVELGDLEMGRHEASRILKQDASRLVKADALLMMGEIAVRQDSFLLAEKYLEEAIETSPDGYTKAKARFELGQIRENQQRYEGALEAYQGVSRYDPSESLKIESIIRQTSMLKILERNEEAVEMIQEMLESERFVDVRGQLEVELGKLYRSLGEPEKAILRFEGVLENYGRKEEAAAADFFLGELYLLDLKDYKAARQAYSDIRTQFTRSEFAEMGAGRLKQIDRYEKIQLDHHNLQRQLAGYPPKAVKQSKSSNRRSRESSSRRSRRGAEDEDETVSRASQSVQEEDSEEEDVDPVPVSAEDSLKFMAAMDDNRYAMAEYMLFEFGRVDTVLELCEDLESNSQDSTLRERAAYMRYYALDVVQGDSEAGAKVLDHIEATYPEYYQSITSQDQESGNTDEAVDDPRFEAISSLFEKGDHVGAGEQYLALWKDEDAQTSSRAKACFNYAWINDHYLYEREAALSAYLALLEDFEDGKYTHLAQERYDRLKLGDPQPDVSTESAGMDPESEPSLEE